MATAKTHPKTKVLAYDNAALEEPFFKALGLSNIQNENVTFTINPKDIEGADMVILATPVGNFDKAIKAIAPYVTDKTIFTDVGSVKELSQRRIRLALDSHVSPETAYVPFHILNGNAGSGPSTADASIFKAPGVLVPGQSDPQTEKKIEEFWRSLGTTVHKMSARKHDAIFGTASHLEHVIMFSVMKTDFMTDWLYQRGESDPGNWIQAMTRIADASPDMWIGNFNDNKDQILKTAQGFRRILTEISELATKEVAALPLKIEELHSYAKDKRSARIAPFERSKLDGTNADVAAAMGLLSLAITANVKRVEEETGQPIAPLANPSLKDGLGPVAIDPKNVAFLLKEKARKLGPTIEDFLKSFDKTVGLIKDGNDEEIRKLIESVTERRRALPQVFSSPTVKNRTCAANPRKEP